MEQVVPGSIVYSDIKPEAIMNDVRLVKYYPTSNVNGQLPQDVIRFDLRGNGFFDPFSAYVYFELEIPVSSEVNANDANQDAYAKFLDDSAHSLIQRLVIRSEGTELERLENYDVMAKMINDITYTNEMRKGHAHEGFKVISTRTSRASAGEGNLFTYGTSKADITETKADMGFGVCHGDYLPAGVANDGYKGYSQIFNGIPNIQSVAEFKSRAANIAVGTTVDGGFADAKADDTVVIPVKFSFPLYSGILGLLMPEKKMLPLSYMPMEVEFTLNPYAFYSTNAFNDRRYTVRKMEIHTHLITFEHEVSQQLDAVVARQGLYIPYESFFQVATTVTQQGAQETSLTIPINAHFKSITSLHMVAIPAGFETKTYQKKLQFPSCAMTSLQVRNGINYIPSLPITGDVGKQQEGGYVLFYQEMLKSWNKLHDTSSPVPIEAFNYCNNSYISGAAQNYDDLLFRNIINPTCQYGISFVGEELGKEQQTITGKRGLTPFDIECRFVRCTKILSFADDTGDLVLQRPDIDANALYFIPYVRADFLLYIRPDLVIQVLGK